MQRRKGCGFDLKWRKGRLANRVGYQVLFQKEGTPHRRQPPDIVSFKRAVSNWGAFYLIWWNVEVGSNLLDNLGELWMVHAGFKLTH